MKINYLLFQLNRRRNSSVLKGLVALSIGLFAYGGALAQTYTFTNAGASGQNGPSQSQVNSAYSGTTLDAKVTVLSGIQYWVVPNTGTYKIETTGGQGYGPYGGRGAYMSGDFLLHAGDTLKILVGQKGAPPVGSGTNQFGGGGGSFVTYKNNTPIIIAGGGGGSWASTYTSTTDASTGTSGNTAANGPTNGSGGSNGSGGADGGIAGGGGGLTGDGGVSPYGGLAFVNGGTGGKATSNGGEGGFGGGGGANSWDNRRGGGGGGYSGGGGAGSTTTGYPEGGGGGSYNAGTNQSNLASVGYGDGSVIITTLKTGAHNDMGVISIDSPTVFCSGIHNVVATIQNFGANTVDSVHVNWSVNGSLQPVYYYAGSTIDTIGGSASATRQVTIGNYNFGSSSYLIKVWTSNPNGGSDTVHNNDTTIATKQVNLPAPGGLRYSTLNATNATLEWNGGSVSNTWAYVNSTSIGTPTGPGTTVSSDSVYLNNLNERTTYYLYVREICSTGDSSSWAGPFQYRTPCANILNGTYTIDPSQSASATNFKTFGDAAYALSECGVSGPVLIQVASGTFTERVDFQTISGASSTNTITFQGAGKGSTILTNNGSSSANWANILMNGTDYVTFRDMTIRAQNSTNGIGVLLTNQADHNQFINLNIEMNTSSTNSNVWGIAASGSSTSVTTAGDAANYTLVDSVTITGGYGGVSFYGTSSSGAHSFGNKVKNSSITGTYYYGIRFYYQNELVADRNTISNFRNSTTYGMYVYYSSDYIVSNNNITSNYYGLNVYYCDRYLMSGSFKSLIYNNMITSNNYYTVYCYYTYDANFYHNTIVSQYASGNYFAYANNLDCRNNIFVNKNTSSTGYVMYIVSGSQTHMDYNIYSGNGGSFIYHDAAIPSYNSWLQTFPTLNLNSQELAPDFQSATDFHLDYSNPFPRGERTLNIADDIDGDLRCEIAPTIGADESEYQNPSPTAGIASSDSVYLNSPTTFYSAYQPLPGLLWDYTWYVDDVLKSTELNFTQTFANSGTYEVKLRARSCSGSDLDSIQVSIVTPTSSPVTDFTANKLILDITETSDLSDLSHFGATQWEWTAEPSSDAVFSNAYSSNPSVFFTSPGTYRICLKTDNGAGAGNKLCKNAYISVNDDQVMCTGTSSSHSSGRISDDGSSVGNYSANSSCNFRIEPCAGKVTLRFTQWALADGDDELKVYAGTDNSATLLGTFTGNSTLPGGVNGLISNTGKMYLEWNTSPTGQAAGFIAYWTSEPDPNAMPPVADFTVPDSIFIDQVVKFESTSTGDGLSYDWDFDYPNGQIGLEGGNKDFDRYKWNASGTYPIALKVHSCSGGDTMTRNIQVYVPNSAPVVGFTADRTKVPVLTTVTLSDSSYQGGTKWKWTVTPSNTANILTPLDQPELKVSFIKSGKYTVKLWSSNSIGADSLIRVDYIDVFDYCAPVVGNLSNDVAISRVKFGHIDNFSGVGTNKYSSYLNDFPAEKIALRDSVEISIERLSNTDPINRKIWVDWNNDGDFNDAGEEVASQASGYSMVYTTKIAVPSGATAGYTTLRVGVSYGQDVNRPCGINPTGEFEDYPVLVVVDNMAPLIQLHGQDTVWVEKGYSYVDAGAIATDNIDGDLTSLMNVVNNVDTSQVGSYWVRYNVSDLDGNAATEAIRVVIVTPDVTKPVIVLNGNASINVTVNTSYTDSGATASDYFQMNLTPQLMFGDNIDLTTIGSYYYYYTVEDAAGNKDSVVRIVNVIDDINPVLNLLGNNPLHVEVFSSFNDPGYTVSDNYYTLINVQVDSSTIQLDKQGVYTVTYTAKDGSGNLAMLTREVIVEDKTAPVLSLIGSDTVMVDVFTSYNEQGVQVTDNFCSGLKWSVDIQPNIKVLGDYMLTYSSTDCNGNTSATLTRVVRVVDRIAPVLTLNGFAVNSVQRWEGFNDPGVSIDDNYYSESDLQDSLVITSNLDPNWIGLYSICYQVTDPSGNKSGMICRTVNVVDNVTSVNEVNETKYNIYPNPSRGQFSLDFGAVLSQSADIKIMDMTGKVVYDGAVQPGRQIANFQLELSQGMYYVMVNSNANRQILKIQILP
ncbi:MAG: DUF5011 domain-containing protein [Bacteroidetes bacterium]|nr:DUF5011 domain-containing protein [Bacteroidota bacterium]